MGGGDGQIKRKASKEQAARPGSAPGMGPWLRYAEKAVKGGREGGLRLFLCPIQCPFFAIFLCFHPFPSPFPRHPHPPTV